MNKFEVKKLFWKLADGIVACGDTVTQNKAGVVVERGIALSDYYVMFGLDDGVIRIYNSEYLPIAAYTEESEELVVLKELFEDLE
ncbi:hypothetical protein CLTEP_02640 [Clostridium tepidiprofundi DSM 19306]|uniref:Uncharacterized protein n=1 Tax=Clostridium tepidiprofundi DSM 19306 TaxID=1121338 RepID=A0A151B7E7_9CLOT|nr:hypothetical protein [Clostridium tepidiprofundi]KYH35871.1 hypothetical protein CLTEP_02640 [Clostridium tepidiprofundi DSM 19306]